MSVICMAVLYCTSLRLPISILPIDCSAGNNMCNKNSNDDDDLFIPCDTYGFKENKDTYRCREMN